MVGFWFLEKAPDRKDREKGELGMGEMKKRKKNFCLIKEKTLRLCLVRVKAFLENILFSGNAIFRKGKCFYVFGKCYKEKTNPENTDKTQIDARCLTGFDGAVLRELQFDDRAVDHDLAKHRVASRDRD